MNRKRQSKPDLDDMWPHRILYQSVRIDQANGLWTESEKGLTSGPLSESPGTSAEEATTCSSRRQMRRSTNNIAQPHMRWKVSLTCETRGVK